MQLFRYQRYQPCTSWLDPQMCFHSFLAFFQSLCVYCLSIYYATAGSVDFMLPYFAETVGRQDHFTNYFDYVGYCSSADSSASLYYATTEAVNL